MDVPLLSRIVRAKPKMRSLPIWQLRRMPDRLRPALFRAAIVLRNTINCCALKKNWVTPRVIRGVAFSCQTAWGSGPLTLRNRDELLIEFNHPLPQVVLTN